MHVDEEVVWYLVDQTRPNKSRDGDHSALNMILQHELVYRVEPNKPGQFKKVKNITKPKNETDEKAKTSREV